MSQYWRQAIELEEELKKTIITVITLLKRAAKSFTARTPLITIYA
jgi:hypothetical protein